MRNESSDGGFRVLQRLFAVVLDENYTRQHEHTDTYVRLSTVRDSIMLVTSCANAIIHTRILRLKKTARYAMGLYRVPGPMYKLGDKADVYAVQNVRSIRGYRAKSGPSTETSRMFCIQ